MLSRENQKSRIALISTGGTIEKTYDVLSGIMDNQLSVLDVMLNGLTLEGVEIERIALMNKDSLKMETADHEKIAATVKAYSRRCDGIIVVHGTDRLCASGEVTCERMQGSDIPVVFTGAMRPYALRNTDAMQNLVEALLAVQILPGGVYVAIHNRVLQFPGVVKDYDLMTFRYQQ